MIHQDLECLKAVPHSLLYDSLCYFLLFWLGGEVKLRLGKQKNGKLSTFCGWAFYPPLIRWIQMMQYSRIYHNLKPFTALYSHEQPFTAGQFPVKFLRMNACKFFGGFSGSRDQFLDFKDFLSQIFLENVMFRYLWCFYLHPNTLKLSSFIKTHIKIYEIHQKIPKKNCNFFWNF